jgi:hypothetical protein
MKTRRNTHTVRRLGQAISAGALVALSPGLMAQEPARQPEPVQQQEPLKPEPVLKRDATLTQEPALTQQPARTTVTGSHIARVRKEPSLPLLILDRSYIDQSGAITSRELIQTVPQVQNFRAPALPPSSR